MKYNQIASIIIFFIGVMYLTFAFNIKGYPYAVIDSDIIPKILGFILILLSVILFLTKDNMSKEDILKSKINKDDIILIIFVFISIFIYAMTLEIIGFLINTMIFIFVTTLILGYKKHFINFIVSVTFPIVIYALFNYILKVTLPSGILPF